MNTLSTCPRHRFTPTQRDDTLGLVSRQQHFYQHRLCRYNRSYILETEKKRLHSFYRPYFPYYRYRKHIFLLLTKPPEYCCVSTRHPIICRGMNYCSVSIQTREHLYPIFTGTVRYLAQPQKGMFSYAGLKYAVICCCVIFWYSLLWKKTTFISEVLPLSVCLAVAQNEMNQVKQF